MTESQRKAAKVLLAAARSISERNESQGYNAIPIEELLHLIEAQKQNPPTLQQTVQPFPLEDTPYSPESPIINLPTVSENYPRDVLVTKYIYLWLKRIKCHADSTTFEWYRSSAELHVISFLAKNNTTLRSCSTELIQSFLDSKSENGRVDGKGGLSPRTIRTFYLILKQSLDLAVDDGLIETNPCAKVELPRMTKREPTFYNAEQLKELFAAIAGEPIEPIIRMSAIYGLRRSEVLGIKWDSVDFYNKTIAVRHTVCKYINVYEKDTTKTSSSRHNYPMTPVAQSLLLAAQESEKNQVLVGWSYISNDYVFKWPDGHCFSPDYITSRFAKIIAKNNLPHIRFHDLKHSCASLLLNDGFGLKDVQELCGHSDIQTTANIYGHLDLKRKQNIADKISRVLDTQ